MARRMLTLAISALFLGYLGTAAAQDKPGAQDKQTEQGAMGAPAGGFKWPAAAAGELKAEKGKVDKWEDGKVKTGGILGVGGKDLTITDDTMIVSEDGKKLSRKDIQAGREIAAIYKEKDKPKQNTALVVVVSEEAKGAGAPGQPSEQPPSK